MAGAHREVELRLVIADPEGLRHALERVGARPIGRGLVRTTSYDYPDRRLRAGRQTLRVREDWTGTTLTVKTPLRGGPPDTVRAREELNLPLSSDAGPSAHVLLQRIGLEETLSYAKERASWQLGDARVDVDVLSDGGGCYAEIEAEPERIAAVREQLGLAGAPVETRSYFEIVRQARESG